MSETSIPLATAKSTAVSTAATTEEGCPTPLVWQDVLTAFRQDRRLSVVESGSVRLQAAVFGQGSFGQGSPLYLLPGFVGDHELFALLSWLLRDECCCVIVDTPALAGVRQPAEETLRQWASAIDTLADQLGHEQLRLHASSFGCLVAQRLMRDMPARIESASLHCGFAQWSMSLVERMVALMGRRSSKTLADSPTAMRLQQQNHRDWFPPFDHSRWDFYAGNMATTTAKELAARSTLAHAIDLRNELSRIDNRVLLVNCEGDGSVSQAAQSELGSLLSHCQAESLDNCGRLPHVTHPHRLVKLLRAFWNETHSETTPH